MKILLCIYVCLVVLPSFKAAAEVSGDWEYSVSGGEAIINNYTGPGGGLVIPETLAGLPVKEIGALALSGKGITSLTIPDTIIRLGGIVLNRNTNNQLVLNYEILQSNDLQNWAPYQQNELVISNAPADKLFLRVQAVR